MPSYDSTEVPLSIRGQHSYDFVNLMSSWNAECGSNKYHPLDNPKGIINLGEAENVLCADIIHQKMNTPELSEFQSWMQYYFDYRGIPSFRKEMARFLRKQFRIKQPLDPENIIITSGTGGAIDLVSHAFTDPGDCFLCLAPYYGVMKADLGTRGRVRCFDIHLSPEPKDDASHGFEINREILEEGYQKAIQEGEKVKGLVIINPDNPTGNVYSRNTMHQIIQFAASHDLHTLWDEVYGMSIFDKETTFHSILAEEDLPQPDRTHLVWSFSKDFGMSGFRCGVLHSWNKALPHCLRHMLYMGSVPCLLQHKLSLLIQDEEWLDNLYFPTNLSRMRESHKYICDRLNTIGAKIHPSKGGYFIWADFSKVMNISTTEEEIEVFEALMGKGVYITPGSLLSFKHPGWFRMVFTHPVSLLKEAMDRLESFVMMSNKTNKISAE